MKKVLRKIAWGSLVAGFILGFAVIPTTLTFNHFTSTEAFCGNACHSMSWIANDPVYMNSAHQKNDSGVIAQCKDCHLPRGIVAETWAHIRDGSKDLFASLSNDFSDQQKWEVRRQTLAHKVRQKMIDNDSSNCRSCHQLAFQAHKKERVGRQHELGERHNVTSVQCHFNLVHAPITPTAEEQKGLRLLPDYAHTSDAKKSESD